jgi:hypothetical protein
MSLKNTGHVDREHGQETPDLGLQPTLAESSQRLTSDFSFPKRLDR